MEELVVLVSKKEGASLPGYATPFSSGMDLCAFLDDTILLRPMERALVPTGLFVGIPQGYEAEVRPRSGIAHKFGVTVLNAPGTIDSDYRGEVKVLLINLGEDPFPIRNGDRIAQIIFKATAKARWEEVEVLPDSTRGQGGFGSTGI